MALMEQLTLEENVQLSFVAAGWTMGEIALEFEESLSAAKRRQTAILHKLGARNSCNAVALAIREGWIV